MKVNCVSFVSCLTALLLLAASFVGTLADEATTPRDLKELAKVEFSEIFPTPGGKTTDPTFSIKAVNLDKWAITEVKLLYRREGSNDKFEKTKLNKNDNYGWSLEVEDLTFGRWEWYLEAKNENKLKRQSTDDFGMFTFEYTDGPPPPTAVPSQAPSAQPTASSAPSTAPSGQPSKQPSAVPDPVTVTYGLQENCNSVNTDRYDICLDLVGTQNGVVQSWMDAFADARAEWEQVITGHVAVWGGVGSYMRNSNKPIGTSVPNNVDDLYLLGKEANIDGRGGVLGRAGPTVTGRVNGRRRPVAGIMEFDSADIKDLQAAGTWGNVIKHEMGHVIGIGILWETSVSNNGWYTYEGTRGREEWTNYCPNGGSSPPVENGGGQGTKGGHWDEFCFDNAMMTGYLNGAVYTPMSVLTVAALEDMGYQVSYDSATAEDLETSPCCSGGRRERNLLRGGGGGKTNNDQSTPRELHPVKPRKTPMSEAMYERAANEAAKTLAAAQDNAPEYLPEGFEYVGGDYVSILAIEDGEIKEETFEWEQVRHRLL